MYLCIDLDTCTCVSQNLERAPCQGLGAHFMGYCQCTGTRIIMRIYNVNKCDWTTQLNLTYNIVGDSFMKRILTSTDLISAVSCLWRCLPAHRSPDWCLDPELLSPVEMWTVQVFTAMCCCRTLSSAELWKDKQQVVNSTNVISFQNR